MPRDHIAAPSPRDRSAPVRSARSPLERWTLDLGLAREAAELHATSDVIDLHVDTFIWTRLFGYDPARRHGRGWFPGWLWGQADLPRLLEAGVTGATWVITANPFANGDEAADALLRDYARLSGLLTSAGARLVTTRAEYTAARAAGRHAAFVGLQGGNALVGRPELIDLLHPGALLRVTLVHLTSSGLGATSSPLRLGPDTGLTSRGRDVVHALEARRVLVDLAHIGKRGFWDVVAAHDRGCPLVVTHTGVSGVHDHWRNLDDAQLRAIADSGGTVGIMYHAGFLGDPLWGGRAETIVRHIEHVIATVGEDHASLGSDWDGSIVTPRDLATATELPLLTGLLLRRGHTEARVRKVLGGNFLRVLSALR